LKKNSYTLAEAMIVVVILGIIATCCIGALKKGNFQEEMYTKAGANYYLNISLASRQILAKYSYNYNMTALLNTSGTRFSITDESNAESNLAGIFKKTLGVRTYTAPSTYTTTVLKNKSGTAVGPSSGYKVSDFTQGFKTKNGTYFALKLNKNCTTSEQYIYDPSIPDTRTVANSCGLIFYDVNADEAPNTVGVDIYILAIKKTGVN